MDSKSTLKFEDDGNKRRRNLYVQTKDHANEKRRKLAAEKKRRKEAKCELVSYRKSRISGMEGSSADCNLHQSFPDPNGLPSESLDAPPNGPHNLPEAFPR